MIIDIQIMGYNIIIMVEDWLKNMDLNTLK